EQAIGDAAVEVDVLRERRARGREIIDRDHGDRVDRGAGAVHVARASVAVVGPAEAQQAARAGVAVVALLAAADRAVAAGRGDRDAVAARRGARIVGLDRRAIGGTAVAAFGVVVIAGLAGLQDAVAAFGERLT